VSVLVLAAKEKGRSQTGTAFSTKKLPGLSFSRGFGFAFGFHRFLFPLVIAIAAFALFTFVILFSHKFSF
jgi:hypothetical protein